MRIKLPLLLSVVLGCTVATLLLPAAEKEKEKKEREEYSATAIVASGPGASVVSFTIRIDSFTPDEEVLKLAEILKSQGPQELAKAVEKTERGRIAPVGRIGNDINVARSFQTEKGRVIRLFLNRPLGFLELRHAGRSLEYQFSVIELILNDKGEGEGVAVGAAKIRFNEKNELEIESYGQSATRITNVHRF